MYFRVRAKAKNHQSRGIRGLAFFMVSFLLAYCLLTPAQAGAVGQVIARIFFLSMGHAAFLVPALLVWFGWMCVRSSYEIHWRLDAIWALILSFVGASFMTGAGALFYKANLGGWIGLKLNPFFYRLFGGGLSLLVMAALFLYVVSQLVRVSIRQLLILGWHKLVEDYREWQMARTELRKAVSPKIKTAGGPQVRGAEPKIEQTNNLTPDFPNIVIPSRPAPKSAEAKRPSKPAGAPVDTKGQADRVIPVEYKLPPLDFLSDDKENVNISKRVEHLGNAALLTRILADFDIAATVKEIIPGPVVTRYDIELAPGIKIQSVVALSDNIALSMKSPSIRVVPVPEKSAVGVEVPNSESCIVGLKGVLSAPDFQNSASLLTLALGKTTDGAPCVTNLLPMPHLLIAGATGSGKSVCIHSLILSILYKARPDEVKLMLIDPKRLEMPTYRGLPHIYDPRVAAESADIITQPKDAAESLKKLVKVMEKRYEKFAREAVRNIEGYNEKMAQTGGAKEFYIMVVIDELADLMLVATNDIEDSIQRLAQMARAVGIHLILATQRPSVDVITGVIKANFPARIAFQTTSKVDSRVILDAIGADALLGKGDMLFLPPGESRAARLQGAFVSMKEAERVVEFIRAQNFAVQYEDLFARTEGEDVRGEDDEDREDMVQALRLVVERKRVSQDLLKAHFGSSARATNLLSILETRGFINKPEGTNRWTIYFDKINDYLKIGGDYV
jgi:S-DNA-T family DNA segregation ATPase FtsK/SpoIIIE